MITIANAAAFWGDQPDAAARLVAAQPNLDFITFDYLAELSLSIMAIIRAKDPYSGYARDFVDVVRSLLPFYRSGGRTRLITNAGGLDPERCALAVAAVLHQVGLTQMKIAVVTGDNVLPLLQRATTEPGRVPPGHADAADVEPFANLETNEPLASIGPRLMTANAYLGADAIAAALRAGADIVITGRVADPSLVVGPAMAAFGWSANDYDRIAGATVAGHLIECGTQACGGFSTDWLDLPADDIGFPIVELSEDGSCVLTKQPQSGGAVTIETAKEQLLYEIGDPGNYLSPDATVSFLTLQLETNGRDRVRVSGATGRPAPSGYKVSASYRDGYKAHSLLTVLGHDAVPKARRAGNGMLQRLQARGCSFRETRVECLGSGASVDGIISRAADAEAIETVLRVSVAADDKEPVVRFTKEISSLVTCGPQGITGYASGRPKVMPIFGYWPCLIERHAVSPQWRIWG